MTKAVLIVAINLWYVSVSQVVIYLFIVDAIILFYFQVCVNQKSLGTTGIAEMLLKYEKFRNI